MIHDLPAPRDDVLIGLSPARIATKEPLPPLRFIGGVGSADDDNPPRHIRIILGESCCGQTKDGPELAPRFIASRPFVAFLEALGWTLSFVRVKQIYIPSPPNTNLYIPFSVAATCNAVTEAVVQAHLDGAMPLLLGGDHCLAMGSVRGSALYFNPEVRPLLEESHSYHKGEGLRVRTPSMGVGGQSPPMSTSVLFPEGCASAAAAALAEWGWADDDAAEEEGRAILQQGQLPSPKCAGRMSPSVAASHVTAAAVAATAAASAAAGMSDFPSCNSFASSGCKDVPSLRGLLRSLTAASGYNLSDNDLCVVWIDAHADVNGPSTSPTGNMHGMPLAALLGVADMEADAPGFTDGRFHVMTSRRVAWIGLRDVDVGERELIVRAEGNPQLDERGRQSPPFDAEGDPTPAISCAFDMIDVDRHGVAELVTRALQKFPPNAPIHISFDVDSIDPLEAPSTGTPVDGGLRLYEAIGIVRALRRTGRITSMDIVEVNPCLGDELDVARTVSCAQHVIAHALGKPEGY